MCSFGGIFEYEDSTQSSITRDRIFTECTFLRDFYNYRKGDHVECISIGWDDYYMHIGDDIFEPQWILLNE